MTLTLRVAGRYLEARAAKYQAKKKVPKADGTGETTVYVYSERQIQNRHREKAERLESLKGKISDIRKRYRKELTHEDPRTRLTALAVGLIDETYERVGNPQSKENGHYGITTLTKDHVTFGPKGAILRYTGKSGVDHEKRVEDPKLVEALRAALKGKKAKDPVFCEGDDCVVSAKDVNAFLKGYDVTAKDLRGLHANEEVRTRLKAIRNKGPSIPEDAKEREKLLKSEFKQAIQEAAEAVGHEPATLRGQYLVPGLEEAYLKDGKVMTKLNKKSSASPAPRRVVARYVENQVDWYRHLQTLRKQVGALRGLRSDYLKQIGEVRRSVRELDKSLARFPEYREIRQGLYRAEQSLDSSDLRTTSFLVQLDELTGLYEDIGESRL